VSTSGLSEPTTSSTELRVQFWILVGVFNVAVLATALGVLVLVLQVVRRARRKRK